MCRWIPRVNSIIRLVVFAGGRHGGDFGFGAGASAFFSGVATVLKTNARKNSDDADDDY